MVFSFLYPKNLCNSPKSAKNFSIDFHKIIVIKKNIITFHGAKKLTPHNIIDREKPCILKIHGSQLKSKLFLSNYHKLVKK